MDYGYSQVYLHPHKSSLKAGLKSKANNMSGGVVFPVTSQQESPRFDAQVDQGYLSAYSGYYNNRVFCLHVLPVHV